MEKCLFISIFRSFVFLVSTHHLWPPGRQHHVPSWEGAPPPGRCLGPQGGKHARQFMPALGGVTPKVHIPTHQDTSRISQAFSIPSSHYSFHKGGKMLILAHEKAFPSLRLLCHPIRSPTARSRYIYLTRNGHTLLEGFWIGKRCFLQLLGWGLN